MVVVDVVVVVVVVVLVVVIVVEVVLVVVVVVLVVTDRHVPEPSHLPGPLSTSHASPSGRAVPVKHELEKHNAVSHVYGQSASLIHSCASATPLKTTTDRIVVAATSKRRRLQPVIMSVRVDKNDKNDERLGEPVALRTGCKRCKKSTDSSL